MDCIGKYNIHRFMALLAKLGIQHSVLYDDDKGNEEHAEINQLIHDSKDVSTTFSIQELPGNIEVFLGAPPCEGHPSRKPQHLMYHYERGNIGKEQLEMFCKLVSKSLPSLDVPDILAAPTAGVGSL